MFKTEILGVQVDRPVQAAKQRQEHEGADGPHRLCLVADRAPATPKSAFASKNKTPYGTKSEEVASFTRR